MAILSRFQFKMNKPLDENGAGVPVRLASSPVKNARSRFGRFPKRSTAQKAFINLCSSLPSVKSTLNAALYINLRVDEMPDLEFRSFCAEVSAEPR